MAKELQHLPDIPNAGYSTRRQKETSDAVMFFMRGVERKRELLLDIVIDGKEKWRGVAGRVWRGLLIDKALLDSIYDYFLLQAGKDPEGQRETLRLMEKWAPQRQPPIDPMIAEMAAEFRRWGR